MGVMSCSRNGCANILCDRYSSTFGYICDECYAEMVASGRSIKKFMASHKTNNYKNKDYEGEFQSSRSEEW